jgi:hypothetical protein
MEFFQIRIWVSSFHKIEGKLKSPKEQGNFKLFLYSNDKPNQYGEILGSICDDYDYKLVARADKNQNVNIEIFRNEYDIETIPPEFFQREFARKPCSLGGASTSKSSNTWETK